MFSQNLSLSSGTRRRQLGSMTASFTLHALVIALGVALGLWRFSIVGVEATDPSLVATLDLSLRPGDPKQLESRPNTWNEPKAKATTLHSDPASTMPSVIPRPIEASHDLLVNGPVETIASIDFGWHGYSRQLALPIREEDFPSPEQESQLLQALLIKKVNPVYPAVARRAGIQGAVVISVILDWDGRVADIGVVSGPEQLRGAAHAAVEQWRFQPYRVHGFAIPVKVMITVDFVLPGSRGQSPSRIL